MGQPRPLFRLFLVFSNKQYIFYNKSMWKNVMSIQYLVLGFKPTTFGTWVSPPITTRPGFRPLGTVTNFYSKGSSRIAHSDKYKN